MSDAAKVAAILTLGIAVAVVGGIWILSEPEAPQAAMAGGSEEAAAKATLPEREEPMQAQALGEAAAQRSEVAAQPLVEASSETVAGSRKPDPEGLDEVGFRGRIVSELSVPVAGAVLHVRRQRQSLVFLGNLKPEKGQPADENGLFEVRGLRPRTTYSLAVEHPDFQQLFRKDIVTGDDVSDLGDLVVEGGAVVEGRVIDQGGAGVEGADVWAGDSSLNDYYIDLDILGGGLASSRRKVKSGADGRFRLAGLAPGEKPLQARKPGYSRGSTPPMKLLKGDTIPGVTLVLEPGMAVAGTVSDDESRRVAGASVKINRPGSMGRDKDALMAETDANGHFRIEGLGDGYHFMTVKADGYATHRQFQVKGGQGRPPGDAGPRGARSVGVWWRPGARNRSRASRSGPSVMTGLPSR